MSYSTCINCGTMVTANEKYCDGCVEKYNLRQDASWSKNRDWSKKLDVYAEVCSDRCTGVLGHPCLVVDLKEPEDLGATMRSLEEEVLALTPPPFLDEEEIKSLTKKYKDIELVDAEMGPPKPKPPRRQPRTHQRAQPFIPKQRMRMHQRR